MASPSMTMPQLSAARAPLTREISTTNEYGEQAMVSIPAERDLTVYVDKRELVTLMTLGAQPELLVLGYLRNQRLVDSASDIASITVDWDVNAASVYTTHGIAHIEERTAKKVVTTGCGQGSVFGGLMDDIDNIILPETRISQAQLYILLNAIRLQESTYKSAGSVHGCALFDMQNANAELQIFVEDVGRHNAIDTIAGWMWMQDTAPTLATACAALPPEGERPALEAARRLSIASTQHKVFYTTGRLTSEMVIKSAQMGIAVVVSRSGITQMGYDLAQRLGLCTIGRATNKHFLCYTGQGRLALDVGLAGPKISSRAMAASP